MILKYKADFRNRTETSASGKNRQTIISICTDVKNLKTVRAEE